MIFTRAHVLVGAFGSRYQLPHTMALPKRSEAKNLLVVATPSASHVAMSTYRMEPAFMVSGNAGRAWIDASVGECLSGLCPSSYLADRQCSSSILFSVLKHMEVVRFSFHCNRS